MKSVAVDLDGTLARYGGWKKNGLYNIGEPIAGAREFLERLSKKYKVVIYTCRCTAGENGLRKEVLQGIVRQWLDRNKLTYNEIYIGQGKPHAQYYIDDKGIRCNHKENKNAFKDTLEFIGV